MTTIITQEYVYEHIINIIPQWKELKPQDLIFARQTGITNQTFKVTHQIEKVKPSEAIFRVFGKTVEGMFIDREAEAQIYEQVGQAGLGPICYGYYQGTRSEKFVKSKVLKQSQMNVPEWRRKIALKLAQFHGLDIQNIDKTPLPYKLFNNPKVKQTVSDKCSIEDLYTEEEQQMIKEMLVFLSPQEIHFLEQNLPKNEKSIIFSHNDLLANNVLLCEPDNHILFIDFEYASYNYRTFDIGNYFAESQYDYNVDRPPFFKTQNEIVDMDDVRDFIKYYSIASVADKDFDVDRIVLDELYLQEVLKGKEDLVSEMIQEMMNEVPICMMFSHYYWVLWGLIMSKNPYIEFDYIKFCYSKYQKYMQLKEKYFSEQQQQ